MITKPKLNRCMFCGSDDTSERDASADKGWIYCSQCRSSGPMMDITCDEPTKSWNESFIANALETLRQRLRDGDELLECDDGRIVLETWRCNGNVYGDTMLELVINLQDEVGE